MQNRYDSAARADDALIGSCAEQGTAFAPFCPIDGSSRLQSDAVDAEASDDAQGFIEAASG